MSEQMLRRVLWADVIVSSMSVVFTIVAAGLLGDWLEVPAWIPLVVGVALIPWVWFLHRTATSEPLRPGDVDTVVVGNLGWAIAAAILIAGFPNAMSTTGKWLVGIVSLGVLDLGVLQWLGLRRLGATTRSLAT